MRRDVAEKILRKNDRGGYTVPTARLYPFQWSWDSAIVALGWSKIDEVRAWEEVSTMFSGQWDNGMIPHTLFHSDAEEYSPGPEVWGVQNDIPSSSISQPPVWATAVRFLHEWGQDRQLAASSLRALLPKLVDYHQWWYRERDPENTGLVCSYHPWESGMDNSPAWDQPLSAVPEVDWAYQRTDLGHVDTKERPHKAEYDRYLYLVDFFRKHNFDRDYLYDNCSYKVADIGIISILHRATRDLAALCRLESLTGIAAELEAESKKTATAIASLWSEESRCFQSRDLMTGKALDVVTTAGVLPLFGGLAGANEAETMLELIVDWLDRTKAGLASTHPASPYYEPRRYWRGPVWPHINWMIALGAMEYGRPDVMNRLKQNTIECIEAAGFWEYFDAETRDGCGGNDFSWTAAIELFWLGPTQLV